MVQKGEKGNLNFLQTLTDKRFYYLQVSIKIVTILSLICATSEIVFGCWSLNILSNEVHPKGEISSTKSKHVAISFTLFLILSARIIALLFWIRSTRNENLRCYSVTAHCKFLSVFTMLGLGFLIIYFVTTSLELTTASFRPHTEVLLAFTYIAGFDILFSATFAFAVANDLQCKIRREWEYGGGDGRVEVVSSNLNWVRPSSCRLTKLRVSVPQVHEVYV